MDYPFGITATLITRTVVGLDSDNNDVYGDVPTPLPGCVFDPGGSTESVQGQDTVITRPRLFLPEGTVVTPFDKIMVGGQPYTVNGAPKYYTNPFTGTTPGPVLELERVTG